MASEAKTLAELIDTQIAVGGPISIAAYMGLCLTHPTLGYYSQRDPLGKAGDFITAPEVSQMFGELIGFFLVNLWQQMGEPPSFTLLELGPGRGTLLEDALRVASRADGFTDALHLQLFESNAGLRAEQQRRLRRYNPYWQQQIEAFADGPLLVIANEFFDALPIRQFVRSETGWHERVIGLREGKRMFGLSPTPLPDSALPDAVRQAEPGSVYEAGLAGHDAMLRLSQAVARGGGAILVIDYGYGKTRTGETLQAVRRHAFVDPLEHPGQADVSAHVDFQALSAAAEQAGLTVHSLTTQGAFLRRLGIAERAASLSATNPVSAPAIAAALERLTAPGQMGDLFKVLCVTSPGLLPQGVDQ